MSAPPEDEIPLDRLPRGFAAAPLPTGRTPPTPLPAATVVLLREGETGLELLLLRRSVGSGFVPGAWVFPGGRVDPEDHSPELLDPAEGDTGSGAEGPEGPSPAHYVAVVRETFEETGILPGAEDPGTRRPPDPGDPAVQALRDSLLVGETSFPEVLHRLGVGIHRKAIIPIAHWITPEAEPRRYDTRFFAAAVPKGIAPVPHTGEIAEVLWITPAMALERNRVGTLTMIFPTLHTIRRLLPFSSPHEALRAAAGWTVRPILPTLVRTASGVRLHLPGEEP